MKKTILDFVKVIADKQLVLLWSKFKQKNAKTATLISFLIGGVLILVNYSLQSTDINAVLSESVTNKILVVANVLGFLMTSLNGASTFQDIQKIKKIEQDDSATRR